MERARRRRQRRGGAAARVHEDAGGDRGADGRRAVLRDRVEQRRRVQRDLAQGVLDDPRRLVGGGSRAARPRRCSALPGGRSRAVAGALYNERAPRHSNFRYLQDLPDWKAFRASSCLHDLRGVPRRPPTCRAMPRAAHRASRIAHRASRTAHAILNSPIASGRTPSAPSCRSSRAASSCRRRSRSARSSRRRRCSCRS